MRKRVCALVLVLGLVLGLAVQGQAYEPPVITDPFDYSDPPALDRKGEGWSWESMSQTLVLTDGVRIHTSGTAITLPAGASLQIRGTVEIVAGGQGEAHGIVLGSGGTLSMGAGATLKITAGGDGIQAGSLSLEAGSLEITAGGSCLRATAGDLSLGAGLSAVLAGEGSALSAERGTVTLSGRIQSTAAGGGIRAGAGSGDRVTIAEGADVALECEAASAVGIDAGGNVALSGTLELASGGAGILATGEVRGENGVITVQAQGGAGLSASEGVQLINTQLTIAQAGGSGLEAGAAATLTDSTLTVTQAGGDGLSAAGDLALTRSTVAVGKAGGYGVHASGEALSVDPDSTLQVDAAGEDGVWVAGLVTVDGALTVSQASGRGVVSDSAGVRLTGTAQVNAQGDGVSAQLGVTCSDTSLLQVQAGGDGVVSRAGSVTLLARAGEEAGITAGGDGVVSADKVSISQPGEWSIEAGSVGIRAQGDVSVGGSEDGVCNLSITCGTESIWSETGNVVMGACEDLYFFDGTIHVDSEVGKTLSVLEGAGLLYGMRDGFAVGIFRKDYTITADMTPELLQLRTLQIGADYTVTVAAGAQVKVGPLILGSNAHIVVEPGSQMYYNGPTTQVTGQVQGYATAGMDLTAGGGSLPAGASWDSGSKTLTLDGVVVDLSQGPVVKLPAGSTIRLTGGTSRLSAGSQGAVIQCQGDLTVTGGTLEISGGSVGIEAAGSLNLADATLSVKGASQAALSGASITSTNSAVEIYGDGAAARATQGGITFDSLSEEDYHTASQGGSTVLVDAQGAVVTALSVAAGGKAPDTVTTQEQVNPDGTVTLVETDTATGVVNESTTAADGTVTVVQTRPDGVVSTVTASDSGTTAVITLPEGMERAVVALKVPNGTAATVARQAEGDNALIPLCDWIDGALWVYLEGSAQLVLDEQDAAFSDVPENAWYAGAVGFVSGRGLFLGVGEGQFDPLGTTTCGMMATVLHRLAGAPAAELPQEDPPFGPLDPEAYYAQGVAWALANGVVDGTSDGFAPDKEITREQLAHMLYCTAGVLGISQEEKAPLSSFTDAGEASQFAQEGLRWAVAAGILQGRGDGTLDPAGTATRAEVSAMIQRFVDRILQST